MPIRLPSNNPRSASKPSTQVNTCWCVSRSISLRVRDSVEWSGVFSVNAMPRNCRSASESATPVSYTHLVQPHGNDEFAFVVGSQRSFFKRPSTHNLEVDEISRLRIFLREADVLGKPAKAHRIGRIAVSYTHLDVYKRQGYKSMRQAAGSGKARQFALLLRSQFESRQRASQRHIQAYPESPN